MYNFSMISKDQVFEALKTVDDPELGHNLVDLGLIYDVSIIPNPEPLTPNPLIKITMTLTTPGCPLGPLFINQIKEAVAGAGELAPEDVEVNLVFDPPWSPEAMSTDLRAELGL